VGVDTAKRDEVAPTLVTLDSVKVGGSTEGSRLLYSEATAGGDNVSAVVSIDAITELVNKAVASALASQHQLSSSTATTAPGHDQQFHYLESELAELRRLVLQQSHHKEATARVATGSAEISSIDPLSVGTPPSSPHSENAVVSSPPQSAAPTDPSPVTFLDLPREPSKTNSEVYGRLKSEHEVRTPIGSVPPLDIEFTARLESMQAQMEAVQRTLTTLTTQAAVTSPAALHDASPTVSSAVFDLESQIVSIRVVLDEQAASLRVCSETRRTGLATADAVTGIARQIRDLSTAVAALKMTFDQLSVITPPESRPTSTVEDPSTTEWGLPMNARPPSTSTLLSTSSSERTAKSSPGSQHRLDAVGGSGGVGMILASLEKRLDQLERCARLKSAKMATQEYEERVSQDSRLNLLEGMVVGLLEPHLLAKGEYRGPLAYAPGCDSDSDDDTLRSRPSRKSALHSRGGSRPKIETLSASNGRNQSRRTGKRSLHETQVDRERRVSALEVAVATLLAAPTTAERDLERQSRPALLGMDGESEAVSGKLHEMAARNHADIKTIKGQVRRLINGLAALHTHRDKQASKSGSKWPPAHLEKKPDFESYMDSVSHTNSQLSSAVPKLPRSSMSPTTGSLIMVEDNGVAARWSERPPSISALPQIHRHSRTSDSKR
jgi:hypothetical protein